MRAPEIIEVETPTFACNGGGGPLGHPRVFLNVGHDGKIDCPYCGRHFVLAKDAKMAAH